MEASPKAFDALLEPTAVFAPPLVTNEELEDPLNSWERSSLNPRNRIDSLDPVEPSTWRIDGVELDGTRFFIVPRFMFGQAPLRIDVYIPDRIGEPLHLREMLESGTTPSRQSYRANHILRALENWSMQIPDLENIYKKMPFGSQIIIEKICSDVRDMKVHLMPNYDIEQQWLSVKALQAMWGLPATSWPTIIDLADVQLRHQPHEAISLVNIKSCGSTMFIFKSLTRDLKHMYHELKMLLTTQPHPNMISRPRYIVTKKGRFGNKVGVCGFILDYYPKGTLRDILQQEKLDQEKIQFRDLFRWARQITSALLHVEGTPLGFYPDLKPDNILLSSHGGVLNTVVIDLEQRGGWYSWSPPEVYYIEYLEYLASSDVELAVTTKYLTLLREYLPSWEPLTRIVRYRDSAQGYSAAWLALSAKERKAAQVFMLGKLLWCIFERVGSINCGLGADIFKEMDSDYGFPEFKRTPMCLRSCIEACTAGAPEWKCRIRPLMRKGPRIFPLPEISGIGKLNGSILRTQEAAKSWWRQELKEAEAFLVMRIVANRLSISEHDLVLTSASQRPTLAQVLKMLNAAEISLYGKFDLSSLIAQEELSQTCPPKGSESLKKTGA